MAGASETDGRDTLLRARALTRLITAALALAAALAFASPASAAIDCRRAVAATHPSDPLAGAATICLVNSERTRRGLRALRPNWRLSAAARGHAIDMVRRRYFSHTSLSGASFLARIRRTGYFAGARSWTAGENIAWGSGHLGRPRSIVRSWMNSPGHRANILNRRFAEIGTGVAVGSPRGQRNAGTYVHTFGYRR